MLNPFFLQGSKSEQGLIQDLINEQLRMYGIDVHYLPRQFITQNTVIKEVIESQFNNAYPIEAYIETFEGYNDNTTILSKFGIQSLNEITLTISRERFKNYISPLIKDIPNIKLYTRPKEGDLIYFPLGRRLFEIKFVEHEKPFYQLQGLYTYQLKCELFRYQDEIINTGIDIIDDVIGGPGGPGSPGTDNDIPSDKDDTLYGNILKLTMVGVAVTATAQTTIVNGGVRSVIITNRGGGYTTPPIVGFSSAPSGGQTATGVAEMIGGIIVCNKNLSSNQQSVQKVLITNPGFGYTVAPGVKFTGNGSGAAAITLIGDGIVGVVTVTNAGSGYVIPPQVTFSGISSITAEATAVVSAGGSITSILINNAGLGYTVAPTITIGNPSLNSAGNFIFNEKVTGTTSGVTAIVKSWNSVTNVLQVSNVTGSFVAGENIVGAASSASHYLRSADSLLSRDAFASNDDIEKEANEILDFSGSNPFGDP